MEIGFFIAMAICAFVFVVDVFWMCRCLWRRYRTRPTTVSREALLEV